MTVAVGDEALVVKNSRALVTAGEIAVLTAHAIRPRERWQGRRQNRGEGGPTPHKGKQGRTL